MDNETGVNTFVGQTSLSATQSGRAAHCFARSRPYPRMAILGGKPSSHVDGHRLDPKRLAFVFHLNL